MGTTVVTGMQQGTTLYLAVYIQKVKTITTIRSIDATFKKSEPIPHQNLILSLSNNNLICLLKLIYIYLVHIVFS